MDINYIPNQQILNKQFLNKDIDINSKLIVDILKIDDIEKKKLLKK